MASLLALSRAEADEAKRLWMFSALAHASTLGLATAALFAAGAWTYTLALSALVAESIAWYLRHEAAGRHALAEEGRRRASLIENLGSDSESLDSAAITSRYSKRACARAGAHEDPDYWAAARSHGPDRLREALQESAFWSAALFRAAARLLLKVVIALVILIGLAVFTLAALSPGSAAEMSSRVGVIFLTVLITSDALSSALAWGAAASTADRVVGRLSNADPNSLATMAAIFADYATATAGCPPIPRRIYDAKHDQLDKAWRAARRPRAAS